MKLQWLTCNSLHLTGGNSNLGQTITGENKRCKKLISDIHTAAPCGFYKNYSKAVTLLNHVLNNTEFAMANGEIHFFLLNWSNTDCHKYLYLTWYTTTWRQKRMFNIQNTIWSCIYYWNKLCFNIINWFIYIFFKTEYLIKFLVRISIFNFKKW